MAQNWSGLLPTAVSDAVLSAAQAESAVLSLATTRPMPTGAEAVPLVSVAPTASFIGLGERKPYTEVVWSAEQLVAEEIACTTFVPDAVIDDAGNWDVAGAVEKELGAAIARALDAAVLFGTNAPASFPTGGIAGVPVTGADAPTAIDAALAAVEASGGTPNGIISGPQIGSAMRAAYLAAGALPTDAPAAQVWGVPVKVSPVWDASKGDAIAGDFTYLLVGIRRDITVERSRDAVLSDAAGVIIANAFQDDLTLIRAHARFAVAVGTPVQPDGSGMVVPFATADWTAVAARRTSGSKAA